MATTKKKTENKGNKKNDSVVYGPYKNPVVIKRKPDDKKKK